MSDQLQAQTNYREVNGRVLPRYYENQIVIIGLLADLAYPFHRYLEEERARGAASGFTGFTPEDFDPKALRNAPIDGSKFNRTGSFAIPAIPRLPLVHLAQLVAQLDATRNSIRAYKAGRAEFVNEVMRAFSNSVVLAVLKHVASGPVRTVSIPAAAQLDARRQIAKLCSTNDRYEAELLAANESLIWSSARGLANMTRASSSPAEVLNLGRLGLLYAIHKWEPGHHGGATDDEATLGGVARGWIQHTIRRTHQNSAHVVTRPVVVQALLVKALKVRDRLPNATSEQIALELCLAERAAKSPRFAAELAIDRDGVLERLADDQAWIRTVMKQANSVKEALEAPVLVNLEGDESDDASESVSFGYANRIEASVGEVARVSVDSSDETEFVHGVLNRLSPIRQTVVRLTFGLPGARECIVDQFRAMRKQSEAATMSILANRSSRPPAGIQILDAIVMAE